MTNKQITGIMSKKSDHWATPKKLMNKLVFEEDICPLHSEVDNLIRDWECKSYYCNPPYSQTELWIDKILIEVERVKCSVLLLIPARTDTKYFHKLLKSHHVECITFFKGRLRFNELLGAPFPSILIHINSSWYSNPVCFSEEV